MPETYRIGVDVGGTNTDAVILDSADHVIGKVKSATTPDVGTGVHNAMEAVLATSKLPRECITQVMLGTTHCTNALATRKGLVRTGVIRLGAPATTAIPPLYAWPADLRDAVLASGCILAGGHEFNGDEIAPLDTRDLRDKARSFRQQRVQAVAVTSVFSPVNASHEEMARDILREELGADFPITISADIGSMGLLERENATALNAALTGVARNAVAGFQDAVSKLGLKSTLYISQNDGTLMPMEQALKFPVLTIASGPSNSIRGAAYLTGLRDAVVVDIGGTTSDLGILQNGFPRESMEAAEIGGVRTNFRMPDLLSIALGGGSVVRADGSIAIGPESVGYELNLKARIFGGLQLTTTDVAVAAGRLQLGDANRLADLNSGLIESVLAAIHQMLEVSVDRVKLNAQDVPVIVVGGGSFLFPDSMKGVSRVVRPEHFEVANAIGVGIAQISATFDRVLSFDGAARQQVLQEAEQDLKARLKDAGGETESVEMLEFEEVPLAYLPGNSRRVRMKAAARLKHPQPLCT